VAAEGVEERRLLFAESDKYKIGSPIGPTDSPARVHGELLEESHKSQHITFVDLTSGVFAGETSTRLLKDVAVEARQGSRLNFGDYVMDQEWIL
jgi:hypothetical protein